MPNKSILGRIKKRLNMSTETQPRKPVLDTIQAKKKKTWTGRMGAVLRARPTLPKQ